MTVSDTMFEITQVGIIRHSDRGVLLVHSDRRQWHLPDSTLVHEETWNDNFCNGIASMTGITDIKIHTVQLIDNFGPGEVDTEPQYGIFLLCSTEETDVTLDADHDDFLWVDDTAKIDDIELFHPLINEIIKTALSIDTDDLFIQLQRN